MYDFIPEPLIQKNCKRGGVIKLIQINFKEFILKIYNPQLRVRGRGVVLYDDSLDQDMQINQTNIIFPSFSQFLSLLNITNLHLELTNLMILHIKIKILAQLS